MSAIGLIEGPMGAAASWSGIDWPRIRRSVNRLQARIVKAVKAGKWHRVRSLQRLLANSFSAKLLAVRRVSSNRGKQTAGVDGVTLDTPEAKWRQAQQMNAKEYKPQPLRRSYIPKKNGKRRPLGIPTLADRAEQALELLALDPVAECLADTGSDGFRKGRSTHDAIAGCFLALCRKHRAKWPLLSTISSAVTGTVDNSSSSIWKPVGQNITTCMPIPSPGLGPVGRCINGSMNINDYVQKLVKRATRKIGAKFWSKEWHRAQHIQLN